MNQQKKREYWQVFDRFRKSRELIYTPKIAKVLNQQKVEFIEKYKQGHLIGMKLNAEPLQALIRTLCLDAGIRFGHKVLVNIKRQKTEQKARMPIGFNARMQELIEQYYLMDFHDFADSITDTTRDLLQKVLIRAQADGLGFDDTIKQLEATELSRARARLIARTETVTAANSGAHLSAKESGILVKKVWIATQDDRTRHDHYFVSAEAIDIDDPFIVGPYQMDHPGVRKQPNGLAVPPKEVCNCRCVVAYEPVRDAAGRTITN
jgi:uncharacterized protein with gpF-like domain